VSEQFGLERKTRWQVVGDPVDNLVKIRDSW